MKAFDMPIWNDDKLREVARDKASTRTECLLAEALLNQREISRAFEGKLDLLTKMNADNAKMRAVYLTEKQKAELQNSELEAQVRRLKQALYDECTGQSCGAVDCEGGYRECLGCDRRAKMAHGEGWGKVTEKKVGESKCPVCGGDLPDSCYAKEVNDEPVR